MQTEAARSTESRRARMTSVIADNDLRAAVASSYQAVSYFGGTNIITQVAVPDRLEFCVMFDEGDATLVICSLETSMVRTQTDIPDIYEYTEFADVPAGALVSLLRDRGVTSGRVGIEARRLHAEAYQHIREALPDVELVPIDDAIEAAQMVKSEDEIEMLRYGAQSTLDAVLAAAGATQIGDSELDMCGDIASRLMKSGGLLSFMVFGAGERALGAHAEAVDRPLAEGDIWRIDLGARFFDVINSDLARTGIVGEPSSRQEETLHALRATQDAGFNAIEPGRPASEVFTAVKNEFAKQGLPFFMPHIGHGLGIGLHEFPMLEPQNSTPLEVGMVLNIEPMVRVDEHGECYHSEDLAVVTPAGHRLLTKPQSDLIRIGAS
jgi:Xaa-Pro aminopeptidase